VRKREKDGNILLQSAKRRQWKTGAEPEDAAASATTLETSSQFLPLPVSTDLKTKLVGVIYSTQTLNIITINT